MKVKDMIEELKLCNQESEVVVVVDGNSYGATPSVEISDRIMNGFDWDNGKVLIRTKTKIKRHD